MNLQESLKLGVQLHQAGRLGEAEEVYRRVLEADPRQADALHLMGLVKLHRGEKTAAAELIRRAIGVSPKSAVFYANLGVVLDELGRMEESIAAYQSALAINPNHALVLTNLGGIWGRQGKLPQAIAACRRAIAIQPNLPEACNNLGHALHDAGVLDESAAFLRRAIELRPDYAEAHSNLGKTLLQQRSVDGAVACFERAIALRPDFFEAHCNLGNALTAKGERERAKACLRQSVKIAPDFALGHWNLGLALLSEGDFEQGWAEYEWRWRVKEFRPMPKTGRPYWDGSELGGKRIVLHAEQGLGDAIQFIRFVPRVKERGGRIIVACQPALHRLLASVPGVEQWVELDGAWPEHEAHCPLMSLPRVLGTMEGATPYLAADAGMAAAWRARVPAEGRLKIGLAWAGREKHARDRERSITLAELAPVGKVGHSWLCSLQKGDRAAHRPGAAAAGMELTDWTEELGDFAQTAALIDNLDVVVTVDTAVAHLAGAMGKRVWVLLPFAPDWRWMTDRKDSPWYPTMRLFRQQRMGDWKEPVGLIVEALKTL